LPCLEGPGLSELVAEVLDLQIEVGVTGGVVVKVAVIPPVGTVGELLIGPRHSVIQSQRTPRIGAERFRPSKIDLKL
jgi:hypothetical protein